MDVLKRVKSSKHYLCVFLCILISLKSMDILEVFSWSHTLLIVDEHEVQF